MPYVHLVFTLPQELGSLYRVAPRWLVETLFASVAATLKDFAAQVRWMGVAGGQPAFSLVLHTWSQDLSLHLHLHAVMACGVLGSDGQWHVPLRSPNFLFPVRALSQVFRAKFMAALTQWARQPDAPPDGQFDSGWRKALYRHAWVVYAKAPLGGPAQVLEFIRRFLLHVLPAGIKRIRHYGVLANGCKKTQLAQARLALHQPVPNRQALESAQAFMARVAQIHTLSCPKCRGPLQVIESLAGVRHLPGPVSQARPGAGARAPP